MILGRRCATVAKPRLDMCSREALRHPEFKDHIELNKIRDHFICKSSFSSMRKSFIFIFICFAFSVSIESVGAIPPDQLFIDSIKLLMSKCDRLLQEIDRNTNN